ncbi:ComEA family DNA-binding protein [Rhabdaerophilum sp.]|uniref:ComEA family DNA-binding protein n=1 Tax=Rhabdaerophilum sp. TaxID=2717341 RepID=UPI0038D50901
MNPNAATGAEPENLEKVRSARAKAIIKARNKGGRFKGWNDLVARNGVPKNAKEAIRSKLRF